VAKFPEPPTVVQLRRVEPVVVELPAGTELWRVYSRGGPHPTLWNTLRSFGPTACRFDHHRPPPRMQDRAILYCGDNGPVCLAEVFQDTRTIDRQSRDPWLVGFELAEGVELLDLTGTFPVRAGASMALNTGPRPRARRWARALYDAWPALQGLLYTSSMVGGRNCVALWERAGPALPASPTFHRALIDPALLVPLRNAASDLGFGLV